MAPRQIKTARFLQETMRWPHWPWCPVKRGKELGACFDGENGSRTVYLVNLFELADNPELLKSATKLEYNTSTEVASDGWEID